MKWMLSPKGMGSPCQRGLRLAYAGGWGGWRQATQSHWGRTGLGDQSLAQSLDQGMEGLGDQSVDQSQVMLMDSTWVFPSPRNILAEPHT